MGRVEVSGELDLLFGLESSTLGTLEILFDAGCDLGVSQRLAI